MDGLLVLLAVSNLFSIFIELIMKSPTCSLLFTVSLLFSTSVLAQTTWTVDSQEDWQSVASQKGVEFTDGFAIPSGETATLTSSLKRFATKQSAKSIVVDQSPQWLNWEQTENIGTRDMADAPVLLVLGPDNYWMLARYGSKKKKNKKGEAEKQAPKKPFVSEPATLEGFDIPLQTTALPNQFDAPGAQQPDQMGYHAWQSRDMKNWVRHGSVTELFSKWVTTAEQVDGKIYIYYDFPNDQDPHVYVDEDLTDGIPGENMGMAFNDPSDGSDCAVIRSLDGKFHCIYENWSPINARKRSWDSPLAGHAVSEDGLRGFEILAPAVDMRTKPTGKMKTYNHPHWKKENPKRFPSNEATYEVHEPTQKAFGDWAAIGIGEQYYLFGDYDPEHGAKMSTAWFTSSSLDEPFEFCGNIGSGHPDPDVCFAEGQFYLATQQSNDYVSPGPWVETVEVRLGVDTDNDAEIDQWSEWTEVKETYDYKPGFSKHVEKTAAAMDLSTLPEGFGFQFQVRMTDTTENKSKPILDKVTLTFGT